jgi:phosphoribosyl 1,2-cyclic phosphodiesterase
MRFTSLSSGSEGNALVVESTVGSAHRDPTRIMIDCGLALKEVQTRLEQRGLAITDLDAIFVTHEHNDHVGGAARLARAAQIPVLTTHGTRAACPDDFWSGVHVSEIDSQADIALCDLRLRCFPVPHDAREPAQLVIEDLTGSAAGCRLGVLTDVGKSTPHIEQMLSGCDALFIEANHDATLLANSDYPPSLKQRIGGPFGHLSNAQCAELLSALDQSRLAHVVAAHLSRHNNTPEHVRASLAPVVHASAELSIASQAHGFDWITIAQ